MSESGNQSANPEPVNTAALQIVDLMHGRLTLTPAVVVLVGLNLVVFAAMLFYGAGLWHSPNSVQLAWGAGFGPATKDGEWWRLGSAMFLHFGLLHLAINMWALWDAGRLVERLYGTLRFVALYFAGGLTGNLLSLSVQGDGAVSGGASGAVFAVYGAMMVCLWCNRRQIDPVEFRWLFGAAAVFLAATIIFGLLVTGIDNAAHIGGLLTGALGGVALLRQSVAGGSRVARGRWVAAGLYAVAVTALMLAIPAPQYSWKEEQRAREEIRQFLGDDQRIDGRWQQILQSGRQGEASFDELAGQIEADVTREYRESFDQLSALHLDPAAPSNMTLQMLKKYTELRADAAQALAEGLRTKNPARIREALEMARQAPYLARGETPPPTPKNDGCKRVPGR
jgi:rhomboid protease GluP